MAYLIGNEFFACGEAVTIRETENGETHIFRDMDNAQLSKCDMSACTVYGGMPSGACGNTHVTMLSGRVNNLFGGGAAGAQAGNVQVTLAGGVVTGFLYGAGVNDTVQTVHVSAAGGAVRWGLIGGGKAARCGRVILDMPLVTCTNITTGTENPSGEQSGGAEVNMLDGYVLTINCGGSGSCTGDVDVRIAGGRLEKQVNDKNQQGTIRISLWDGIEVHGSFGRVFPMLPERAEVTALPRPEKMETPLTRGESRLSRVTDTSQDDGRLVLRLLEIRDPKMPQQDSLFPEFIGDCMLLTFPERSADGQPITMLVDCGLAYAAEEIVSRLKACGIARLDYLAITHFHSDHMGCAGEILRNFPVGQVLWPSVVSPLTAEEQVTAWNDMLCEISAHDVPVRMLSRGDEMHIGGVDIRVMNPRKGKSVTVQLNDDSMAIQLRFGGSTVMLGADIGEETERELAALYGEALKCDILKVSHHGIVYQSHPEYLLACRPQAALVHSLRPQGVFLNTTRQVFAQVLGKQAPPMFVTGVHGMIRASVDDSHHVDIVTEYD